MEEELRRNLDVAREAGSSEPSSQMLIERFALSIGLGKSRPENMTPQEQALWDSLTEEYEWCRANGYEWSVPFSM